MSESSQVLNSFVGLHSLVVMQCTSRTHDTTNRDMLSFPISYTDFATQSITS